MELAFHLDSTKSCHSLTLSLLSQTSDQISIILSNQYRMNCNCNFPDIFRLSVACTLLCRYRKVEQKAPALQGYYESRFRAQPCLSISNCFLAESTCWHWLGKVESVMNQVAKPHLLWHSSCSTEGSGNLCMDFWSHPIVSLVHIILYIPWFWSFKRASFILSTDTFI